MEIAAVALLLRNDVVILQFNRGLLKEAVEK
jgi:hypothetical protein